jgi:hypothetical protein
MSKPKHQHFIPRSYLKNFAYEEDGKHLVEAKLVNELEPKKDLISIKDICVNKNLYTIPNKGEDEKYKIEKYYASEIDEVYPEVYEWLTDSKVNKISAEQRAKIIRTTMSLFFRTPKFLNNNQRIIDGVINYSVRNCQDNNGQVKFKFKDYDLNFHINNVEEVRSALKIENKLKFLDGHLKDWQEFVDFKFKSPISVYRIYDDIQLITSDNPVFMHSVKGRQFDLFDPTNMISLPLDDKHYLSIFPNTEEAMLDTIYRTDRDKWFALTTNLQVEQSCEDWILGKPNSVKAHLADQLKYNAETEENFQAVEDLKQRAEDGMQLLAIMEEYGFLHEKVAEKVREMLNNRVHKDDLEIRKTAFRLTLHGFKVF